MTDTQLVDWSLKQFGPPFALLAVFVIGLLRKWWVIGWQYETVVTDYEKRLVKVQETSDNWQRIALSAAGIAETSVGIAKRVS